MTEASQKGYKVGLINFINHNIHWYTTDVTFLKWINESNGWGENSGAIHSRYIIAK